MSIIQPSESRSHRRRLLINPKFQMTFALYAIVSTLMLAPFFIAVNWYFFNLFANKARSLGLGPDHELLQFVDSQQVLIVVVFIGVTFLAIMVNLVISYMISNRIAGSLYRLTYIMNQTTDLSAAEKAHPRKYGFFNEVLVAYNQLLDRLK